MNLNGHWYRQCQTGYYYSYFFGIKGMVIDEDFNFLGSGSQYTAVGPDVNGNYTQGALEFTHAGSYGVHTYNTLLGCQTGGKLEYRFCRWTLDTHGNVGMFVDFAHQDSHITTSFTGPPIRQRITGWQATRCRPTRIIPSASPAARLRSAAGSA